MFRDVVVVGASAGGMKALQQMVAYLPADLPAAVLVATHLAPTTPSLVAPALAKAGLLPVVEAVDTLFRSAARWYGPRVIAVVLSGTLDDGAAGLAAVVECGGAALVQEPQEAIISGMPRAALATVPAAEALPAAQLARRIAELAGRPARPTATGPSAGLIWETDMIRDGRSKAAQAVGRPTGLGCPECGGGMTAIATGQALHYACHVGHSYSPETYLAARDENIEAAAWNVVSAMQEKASVTEDLADRAARAGDEEGRRTHSAAADRIRRAAQLIREQLLPEDSTPEE